MDSDRQQVMARMDTMGMEYRDMGRDTALHDDSEALRVAIIAENFLPKIDGSTITIAHLLQHLAATRVRAMLLGPESGMREYAGARLFGTFGVPLRVYPGLKINFISPAFLCALRSFEPHVIHLVDPIWLGVQALIALQILFPSTPIVTSHHTNLPTYAEIFGYPYFRHRTWQVQAYLHSFARYTLVPSPSTARLLREKGWGNLRVVGRGVDRRVFSSKHRSPSLRASWGAAASDVVILSVGRLSPEKNLGLLVWGVAGLGVAVRSRTKLIFVGDGPYLSTLQRLCAQLGVDAIFMGQLTGKRLGEAVGSADVMSSPSITETFGQVTLQGMAAGLPVVGLYVEGTADLVLHGVTGLLLDPLAPPGASPGHAATLWDGDDSGVEGREGWEGGTRNPNPHDSAVSLSLDPALDRPHQQSPQDVVDQPMQRDVDVDERVPDSAISLSPGFCPSSDPSPLDLPDAALALEVDSFPGFSLDEQTLHGAELAPSSVYQAPSSDSQDSHVSASPDSPQDSHASDFFHPSSGGEQGGAPRVGCFRTLAPLMRPESREFVRIVKRYSQLLETLIVDPTLRAEMGRRAEERSRAFRWERTSEAVVGAYVDACREGAALNVGLPSVRSCGSSRRIVDVEAGAEARRTDEDEEAPQLKPRADCSTYGKAKANTHDGGADARNENQNGAASTGWIDGLVRGWTWCVDALVVAHALVGATLSHGAYMVPAGEDL